MLGLWLDGRGSLVDFWLRLWLDARGSLADFRVGLWLDGRGSLVDLQSDSEHVGIHLMPGQGQGQG